MAITDTEIRRSKPGEKPYKIADSGGLHLMITPSGGKLWRWKYRFDGAEKLMALGKYPETSLVDARERHAQARKQLANGIDPMAERKAEKSAVPKRPNTPSRRSPSCGWSTGAATRALITPRRPPAGFGLTFIPLSVIARSTKSSRWNWCSWSKPLRRAALWIWPSAFSK